jgi:hypothetical protein
MKAHTPIECASLARCAVSKMRAQCRTSPHGGCCFKTHSMCVCTRACACQEPCEWLPLGVVLHRLQWHAWGHACDCVVVCDHRFIITLGQECLPIIAQKPRRTAIFVCAPKENMAIYMRALGDGISSASRAHSNAFKKKRKKMRRSEVWGWHCSGSKETGSD